MEHGEMTRAEALSLVHLMNTGTDGGNVNRFFVNEAMNLLNTLSYPSWELLVKPPSATVTLINSVWDEALALTGFDASVSCILPYRNTGSYDNPAWTKARVRFYGGMYNNIFPYLTLWRNDGENISGITCRTSEGQDVNISATGATPLPNGQFEISTAYRNCTNFTAWFYRYFTVDDEQVIAKLGIPFDPHCSGTWHADCNIQPES